MCESVPSTWEQPTYAHCACWPTLPQRALYKQVPGGGERLPNSGQIGGVGRSCEGRQAVCLSNVLTSFIELALQVLLGNLDVAQRHVGSAMAEQLHQRWQADTCPQHGGGKGVPHLMRNNVGLDSGLVGHG